MCFCDDDHFPIVAETPNQPQITELQAYQIGSAYAVAITWQRGAENNYDFDFYEVAVGGVAMTRVKDAQDVIVINSSPPEGMMVEVNVTTVSRCGARSVPASAMANIPAGQ